MPQGQYAAANKVDRIRLIELTFEQRLQKGERKKEIFQGTGAPGRGKCSAKVVGWE